MNYSSFETAFNFLCDRMPTEYDLDRSQWVSVLLRYEDKKGRDAIEGLAGFYLYAIRNLGEKQSNAIYSTFTHDLNGVDDKWCEPRSMGYIEVWREENAKYTKPEKIV